MTVFKIIFFKDKKCLSKHNWKISVHKIYFSTDQFLYSAYLEDDELIESNDTNYFAKSLCYGD